MAKRTASSDKLQWSDVAAEKDVEERGRKAIIYFEQHGFPGQQDGIAAIKGLVASLEGRLARIRLILDE